MTKHPLVENWSNQISQLVCFGTWIPTNGLQVSSGGMLDSHILGSLMVPQKKLFLKVHVMVSAGNT